MKNLLFLFLLSTFVSCQYFDHTISSEDELLRKELNEINWNTVDEYPSIVDCDSLANDFEKKDCFFQFFNTEITTRLKNVTLAKYLPRTAILNIKVTVVPEHDLFFEADISNDSLLNIKPKIDSILAIKLIDFPAVAPAMKKGVFVKTVFNIPYKIAN